MKTQATQPNLYETTGVAAEQWANDESSRLANMDAFYAHVAKQDLEPLFARALNHADKPVQLLDVGAGTGTVTETLCKESGVEYYALDVNKQLLAGRSTDTSHKILASAEATGIPDGTFDITFSRAVTAWNAEPEATIAEQLRITRLGGYAVFTEFDWTHAGAVKETELTAEIMATKAIMMGVLLKAGFNPEYGTRLGVDIRAAVGAAGVSCEQNETRHELPAGDYRGILLESAETILAQLRQLKHPLAAELQNNIKRICDAESFLFSLPTLVTNVVHLV